MDSLPHEPASKRTVGLGSPSRLRCFLAIQASCVAVLGALAWVLDADLIDDSYIFLRYARNIAAGHGAVFNVAEPPVEGFSSPLWTLVLSAGGLAVRNLEVLAYGIGLCCGAGAVLLLLSASRAAGRGHSYWDDLVVGLGLASGPALVFWSASGMDTALFLLLVSASLASILHDRRAGGLSARTGLLLLLTTLARPEGVLLAGYAGVCFLRERRSIRVLIGYAVSIALLLLVRHAYFGAWLPNTYHAKVTFGWHRRLSDGMAYLLPAVRANGLLVLATMAIIAMAWREGTRERWPIRFLGGWVVLWCAYVLFVGGDNFAFFRFLLPALPALVLLLAGSWSSLRASLSPGGRRLGLGGLALAFCVSNVMTFRSQAEAYYGDVRLARCWAKVGRWLDRTTPPGTVVATEVPGALGYFGRRPTIDMLGLTDRTVSVHGRVYPRAVHGHARYDTDYIYQRAPDIVLYHSSGRFKAPVYTNPKDIALKYGYALYDFVTDPRCRRLYRYEVVRLDDGTVAEMQRKKEWPVCEPAQADAQAGRRLAQPR